MELLRRARGPWGEEILVGLGWDLFWVVVVLGAVFVVIHAILSRGKGGEGSVSAAELAAAPKRVIRHDRSARISHWVLAVAVLVLLVTAFVPILGLGFPWVTIHWLAGLVLTAYLLYHVADTVKRRTLGTMWVSAEEIREGMHRSKGFVAREGVRHRQGKWGVENKVFHHITGLAGVAVIGTGLFMMFRVDTWFWEANPYLLSISDTMWGWMYVLHGLASVGFVGLLIAHIYFAVRPDNLWITRSMIKGWITGKEYLEHHDPAKWPLRPDEVAGGTAPEPSREPDPLPADAAARTGAKG
jgi:formate dehydrogenase subunit gamma